SSVPGIGKKKAERLVLELRDKFDDVPVAAVPTIAAGPGEDAVQALVALGYAPSQADEAVTALLAGGTTDTASLIRAALQRLAQRR
ncbi:MAG: helix-hairpin-helix domain-containing protein, partial [Gemmatimonadales bacterium]|nr:helix-hairpin-helix domain-containing protein [Gemmatimonadales bacterium]